jgi:hypothetical protein
MPRERSLSRPSETAIQRPLLEGGERLRQDIDRITSGGEKFHPRGWDDARAILLPQVQVLWQRVAEMPEVLRGSRIVFEAKVLPNYLADSYFPEALFAEAGVVPIGTKASRGTLITRTRTKEDEPTRTFFLAGDDSAPERLAALLGGAHAPDRRRAARARDLLTHFDEIRLPTAEEIVRTAPPETSTDPRITWEAVLHPSVGAGHRDAESEAALVFRRWVDWVQRLDGEVVEDYRRTVSGLTFVPIRLAEAAAASAAEFNPLRALRPMPRIRPIDPLPFRIVSIPQATPAPPADPVPRSDVRVAVFDGGVDDSVPQIAPYVDAHDLTVEPPDPIGLSHGTLVTSALLYGSVDPSRPLETPAFTVDHYRVWPPPSSVPPDVDLIWVLDQIEDTLQRTSHRIVSLSLAPAFSCEADEEPHIWTSRLDELAAERGILFVVAVGNNGEDDASAGLNLVQVPSDMANGLAVGACNVSPPTTPWGRTPYSAVGPGRAGGVVRPTGLCFGGDAGRLFCGVQPGGGLGVGRGTSFAAPNAVRGLATLAAAFGRSRFSPDLLRTFAVHFAEQSKAVPVSEAGYGRMLEEYDPTFDLVPEEVTILYEDQVDRGSSISLPIPLPTDVLDNRNVEIRWTITFTSPVDPADAVDYTLRGVDLKFRPHSRRFRLAKPGVRGGVVLNVDTESARFLELLQDGWQPSIAPVTESPNRVKTESVLRDEGKWETIVRNSLRKRGTGFHLPQVELTYLSREGGALTHIADPLEFVMLASVRAPRGVALYDRVRQDYRVLTPISTEIPIRVET